YPSAHQLYDLIMQRQEQGVASLAEHTSEVLYSSGTRWPGFKLERGRAGSGEYAETYLTAHSIVLHKKWSLQYEIDTPDHKWRKGGPKPNFLQFIPAGMPLAANWKGAGDAIVLHIDPEFATSVHGTDSRTNKLPSTFCFLRNNLLT